MTKELNIVCVYFLCNLMCCITIVILMETLSYIIPRGSWIFYLDEALYKREK